MCSSEAFVIASKNIDSLSMMRWFCGDFAAREIPGVIGLMASSHALGENIMERVC